MSEYSKISMQGDFQKLRIPKSFRFDAKIVKISKHGKGLLIEPVRENFENFIDGTRSGFRRE